ncbi:hypothetical protein KCH_24090 [Kitasatospora cheerisanensis KCTC 2395]|uniref:Uncharacterized protein n=1 Tax=Kitasatospora cheerisanensis KCTC 2395 TaxID=1348663 RepID=A0A066Z5Z8_9ACTN|nr:hypothetical protein KCH_24090 [Kitasatospora cheerisanensis KCTC 2395]
MRTHPPAPLFAVGSHTARAALPCSVMRCPSPPPADPWMPVRRTDRARTGRSPSAAPTPYRPSAGRVTAVPQRVAVGTTPQRR